jgi:hypothetical protein
VTRTPRPRSFPKSRTHPPRPRLLSPLLSPSRPSRALLRFRPARPRGRPRRPIRRFCVRTSRLPVRAGAAPPRMAWGLAPRCRRFTMTLWRARWLRLPMALEPARCDRLSRRESSTSLPLLPRNRRATARALHRLLRSSCLPSNSRSLRLLGPPARRSPRRPHRLGRLRRSPGHAERPRHSSNSPRHSRGRRRGLMHPSPSHRRSRKRGTRPTHPSPSHRHSRGRGTRPTHPSPSHRHSRGRGTRPTHPSPNLRRSRGRGTPPTHPSRNLRPLRGRGRRPRLLSRTCARRATGRLLWALDRCPGKLRGGRGSRCSRRHSGGRGRYRCRRGLSGPSACPRPLPGPQPQGWPSGR